MPYRRQYSTLEQWKAAGMLNHHEDDLCWQKFYYFLGANGALLSVLALLVSFSGSEGFEVYVLTMGIKLFGALISFVWFATQKRGQLTIITQYRGNRLNFA